MDKLSLHSAQHFVVFVPDASLLLCFLSNQLVRLTLAMVHTLQCSIAVLYSIIQQTCAQRLTNVKDDRTPVSAPPLQKLQ